MTLGEELLVLCLDETRGTVLRQASQALSYALAGAAVMDLTLMGRLRLEDRDVAVVDATPTGDDVLDDALRAIAASRRPRSAKHWVNALQRAVPGHRRRLAERLVRRGALRAEEHVTLGVFRSTRHPLNDRGLRAALDERMRSAVLDGAALVDAETAALIGLAQASGVLDLHLSREERRAVRGRVREIVAGSAVGGAVADTVQAVNAAVMAGITAAVTASTSG